MPTFSGEGEEIREPEAFDPTRHGDLAPTGIATLFPWGWPELYDSGGQIAEWSVAALHIRSSRPVDVTHEGGRLSGDARGLFDAIDSWFGLLAQWVEVLSLQDMNLHGPFASVRRKAEGLRVAASGGSGQLRLLGASSVVFRFSDNRPLDSSGLRRSVEAASAGEQPPPDHALMSGARAAERRGWTRRAVIDAGTALELCLSNQLHKQLRGLSASFSKRVQQQNRTLGPLVATLGTLIDLPENLDRDLIQVRNGVVHRNLVPTQEVANLAVRLADDVVGRFGSRV